jgi:hypothetical protein
VVNKKPLVSGAYKFSKSDLVKVTSLIVYKDFALPKADQLNQVYEIENYREDIWTPSEVIPEYPEYLLSCGTWAFESQLELVFKK